MKLRCVKRLIKKPHGRILRDDIVVIEQSGSKTALRRFIEAIPAFGLFMAL